MKLKPKKIKPVRQAVIHECILACLAMVAQSHGSKLKLRDLRKKFPTLQRGGSLRDMIEIARNIGLNARAIKVDLPVLNKVVLPCILHWDFNHFVVLERVKRGKFEIVDPASGRRTVNGNAISNHFTGVALELTPLPSFHKEPESIETASDKFEMLPLKAFTRPIAQFIALSIVALLFMLLSPLAVQIVVDDVIVKNDNELLIVVAAVFFGANLIGALATYLQDLHILRHSSLARISLTHQFLDRLLLHGWAHYSKRNLGGFVAQYNSLAYLVSFVVQNIGGMITNLLFVIILTLILFLIEPSIAWIVLALNLLVVGIRTALLKRVRTLQNNDVMQRSEEEAYFVETMRGISSVKANALETARSAGNIDKTVKSVNASFHLAKFSLKYQFFLQSSKAAETMVTLLLLAQEVMAGRMSLGVMFAFYSYRLFLEQRLSGFVDAMGEALNLKVHKDRLAETFLDSDGWDQSTDIGQFLKFDGKVEFRDVCYRIDNGKRTVFNGFSGLVKKGFILHVRGPTGSGKTTLLRILLQTIEPDAGVVLIDDLPMNRSRSSILRNSVGVVLQEDTLFRGSIVENVTLFDEAPDYARLEECCRLACVHDEVLMLPLGYQSQVGDLGSNLSTGQQQRLLVTRALYSNPTILVLDEATANLNVEIEAQLLENLKALEKTIIFASHSDNVSRFSDECWDLSEMAVQRREGYLIP